MNKSPMLFRRKAFAVWSLFFAVAWGVVSCAPSGSDQSAKAETIRVGVVLPLTGEQAQFGEIEKDSFQMALEEINGAGGVNGKPIELLIEDDTGRPEVGRSAMEKLITQNKAIAIGGGYSSSVAFAIAGVAQQRQVPLVVNTGSDDKITEQNWDYVFRINPPASEYPAAVNSFLQEVVKPKTAALLYENTSFGQSSSKSFAEQAEKLGLQIVLKEGYESGAVDFKPLLTKVKAAQPDLVYMVSYLMDAALLIRQSRELGLAPKLFVGGGAGFTLPGFAANAGDAAQGVFSADLWVPSAPYPGAKEYFDKYAKTYGKNAEYHGAEAYSCLYVIADALKRAKDLTPAAVRQALAETDMKTAFGPVKFVSYDKKTQQNRLPTYLVQWQNGKLETVWPKEFASQPYIYPVP
ncbi:MAG: ABC transporter substrate-binding protein [Candidatus Sumerlaeota bacterium]|nr:ABC transporter substrate-binding protein [Candidatus Sumerlaeota bacterium]